jgi:hypothetical protein
VILALFACFPRDAAHQGLPVPDIDRFHAWAEAEHHDDDYAAFEAVLEQAGVVDVVPPWHLWRQGTDWEKVGHPAFAMPPRDEWTNIVPTLRFIRDDIVPSVGPVEVVSGFRTKEFNTAAAGAPGSRHQWFEAVDVVPFRYWGRESLHTVLLSQWAGPGVPANMGLGLYQATRFHVDTWKHRKW